MATDASVPNNFTAGTPSVADDVDANFAAVVNWINTNATHLDASKAFTAVPSGPATDPSSDNQLTRKAYVDAKADPRCGGEWRRVSTTMSVLNGASTVVVWDTEVEDSDGFWTSGGNLVVPAGKGGIYTASVTVFDASQSFGNSLVQSQLGVGGIGIKAPASFGISGSNGTSVSYTTKLTPGSVVNFTVSNNTGATLTFYAYITLYRVSA